MSATITPLSSVRPAQTTGTVGEARGKHFGEHLEAGQAGAVDLKGTAEALEGQVVQGSRAPVIQGVLAKNSPNDPYADKLRRQVEAAKSELVVATMDDLLKKMFA